MTVQELYDHLLQNMTAEEALLKLLEGHIRTYEHLKFNDGEELHPLMVVSMAALDMGWGIAIPEGEDEEMQGLVVGTEEYLDNMLNTNPDDHPDKEEN